MITLFKSQIVLAEHECPTNWGDSVNNINSKSNQIKCWLLRRGENQSIQQIQPTYDAEAGNRTRDTLVEGERFRYCANPAL